MADERGLDAGAGRGGEGGGGEEGGGEEDGVGTHFDGWAG